MAKVSHKNNRRRAAHKSKRKPVRHDALKKGVSKLGERLWVRKASVEANYARAGVASDVNGAERVAAAAPAVLGLADGGMDDADVPSIKVTLASFLRASSRKAGAPSFSLKPGEAAYLERLAAKHGEDFKAASRDLALNPLQHSAQHLRTRTKRWRAAAAAGAPSADASMAIAT